MNKFAEVDYRFLMFLGVLVCLPVLEALKNIFAFLFVFSWVLIARKENYWGGKWKTIDTIFLLWILADITVSINAVISHQLSGSNFRDIIRFVLIAWVLSRIHWPKQKLFQLASAAIIATLMAIAFAYYISGDYQFNELYSVGHINHSAIFLAIAFSISLSLLIIDFNNLKKYQKIFLILSTLILFFTTVDTNSRAAFGLIILITLIDFIYLAIKSRRLSVTILLFGIVSLTGVMFINSPPAALKRILTGEHILHDEARDRIRNFNYYAFKKSPLLGHGFGNHGKIKFDDIKSSIIKDNGDPNISLYLPSAHAHNVYYTYLVSGGLLIFSIFLWFWFYIIWIIIKLIASKDSEWFVLCSVSVLLINLGIGWVNTTLHHEHAILSMFVLGLLISKYRKTQEIKNMPT